MTTPDARLPHPRKRLGQHFLGDRRVLDRIVDALELTGTETVVEIGPGRGALTDLLVERAGRVIAVEIDRDLAPRLAVRYASRPSVQVIQADVLDVRLGEVAGDDYVLAGNVPYYITTPILFHALERPRARTAVYLVQLEVAERLASPSGSKTYGALSVNVQAVADVELLFRVPPRAFRPPPKVDSAVVRVRPRAEPIVAPDEEARFRAFVQDAFGLRRKQMRRVLRSIASLDAERADEVLRACEIDPERRPETLSPLEFARVMRRAFG